MNLRTHPRLALKHSSLLTAKANSWILSISTTSPWANSLVIQFLTSLSMMGDDRFLPPPLFLETPQVDHLLMFLQGMLSILLISVMDRFWCLKRCTAFSFQQIEQLLQGPRFTERFPFEDQEQDQSISMYFLLERERLGVHSIISSSSSSSSSFTLAYSTFMEGLFTSMTGSGMMYSSLTKGAVGSLSYSQAAGALRWGFRAMVVIKLVIPLGWLHILASCLSLGVALGLISMYLLRLRVKVRQFLSRDCRASQQSEGKLCI